MIFLYLATSVITSWLTYFLIKKPDTTPTRASASVSLVGILIFFVISKNFAIPFENLAALIFGSSFVGMCSHKVVKDMEVIFGAIFFCVLYIYLVPRLEGLGGALGFSAFLSILMPKTAKSTYLHLYRSK